MATSDQSTNRAAQPTFSALPGAFPVVGVVGAAGSRLALEKFFRTLPTDAGMAFIVVTRLAAKEQRSLVAALQARTDLPVLTATDGLLLQSDQIYLVPSGMQPTLYVGQLQLEPVTHSPGRRRFDPFLVSLAAEQGANAVALLLSGAGADGLAGLQAIKEQGGLVLVQEPNDAAHPTLPRRAVALTIADCVDRAGELAQWLVQSRGDLANQPPDLKQDEHFLQTLPALLSHIASQTGHDLSHYKRSTLQRRILRRIQAAGAAALGQYLELLKTNAAETLALFRDCLVSVTSFFRDADAYEMLERDCIPQLFLGKGRSDLVRVWVAGCATGEEAYSVAMQLAEYAAQLNDSPRWQIFATDLDETAITIARRGLYPSTIAKDIAPGRLQRYFTEENGCYRVKPEIRENILFAAHDLLQDPPFSRLDLVCCRNVLIYFTRTAQEKIFATFHYALNPSGYLFLGASESIDAANDLFAILHKQCHLYQRRNITLLPPRRPLGTVLTAPPVALENKVTERLTQRATEKVRTLEEAYAAWSLRVHTPPRLLVNQNYEITHLFGGVERYLQTRDGAVTQNVLQRIHPDLRLELRAALYQAFNQRERTISRLLSLALAQQAEIVQLQVGPVAEPGFPADTVEVVLLVQENPALLELGTTTERKERDFSLVSRLEEELLRTRERLQQIIEEYETAGQELKVSNEELQSINEELKSTTEELETSKEELQSMNEELTTVNGELTHKIEELNRANSDLLNLIASTEVGAIFLNQQLQINRFTPRATDLFNLIEGDIGRPFAHVTHRLRHSDLPALAAQIKATNGHIDETLQRDDDRWFMLRLFPYRTVTGEIDGVVITFIDIHDLKRAESEERQRRQQQSLAELSRQALTGSELDTLFTTATHRIAEVLNMELGQILELQPDGKALLLKAGIGWQAGLIGQATVPLDATVQSGYTLQTHAPVIVRDLRTETRFRASTLLSDHQVRSGMSVTIPASGLATAASVSAYGVLGVYSRQPCTFTTYDVDYLQAVANLLAAAIGRRRIEAALQRYADLLRLSHDAIMVWHSTRGIEFWNQGAEALYGYPAAEALGRMTHELLQTAHFRPWPEILAELQRTGLWEGEVQHTTKTGRKLIVSTRHQLITNADGDQLILETNRDITERKATEVALRQSEERFVTIFQHSPYPIAILDLATRTYVDVNPTWMRDTGYTQAEAVGRTPAELGLQTEPSLHLIERLRTGELVRDQEIRVRLRNGETRTTLVSAELIQLTGQPYVLLIFADITARKQAEERLRFLAEAGALLASSLDYTVTLQNVADAAVPGIADWCVIDLLAADGSFQEGVIAHRDPDKVRWAQELRARYPIDPNAPVGAPQVIRTGQSELYPDITDAMVQAAAKNETELQLLRSVGYRSVMIIPLQTHGRILGAITFVATEEERHFTAADLTMAEELARRAAAVISNAQLHHALQQREQTLRLATEAGRIGIYDHDLLTNQTVFSDLYYAITGVQPHEQITREAWLARIHPDDRALVREKLIRAVTAGESYDYDYRVYHPDGAVRWLGVSSQVTLDATGRAVRLTGAIRDITERKQAEEEIQRLNRDLKRRVDELQTLLDVAPIGIFVAHDAECRIITGNPAGARMLGVAPTSNASKSQSAGDGLPFRVLQDGREIPPAELPMQYATQHDVTVENVEYEIIRSDGTQLNLYEYAIPLHDEEGRVRGCLGIFVDITERKQVEASLRESEERFRSAFEQAAVGMAHVNGDGQYIRVNERLCQILGYDRAELLQMKFLDLTHPADRANGLALSERLLAGEISSYTIEKRYLHHDGAIIWVNISASAVRNVAGEISYRLSVIEDITARKTTEAALHELTATLEQRVHERTVELERSNRELDQFAYVASHDLKAPLRAIVNLAGWIAEDAGPVLPPASLEHLQKLRGRALRMERLLDDLLTYSRIGRQLGIIEPIRIDLLLHDTIDLLAPPTGFTVKVTAAMPVLLAPRAPIALVFRNLINNAIKHHHQPAQGVVRIEAQVLGDFVEFTISDNGPGIAPQYHERIFGMFQTLRPRDEVEGSGMGLAIVKKAVEYHGGLIRVESAVGAGTTFRFTWPKEVFKKTE